MLRITLSANGSLYCCSDGVRGRGAAVKYLSHNASFHSKEKIAPSNRGIKHLGSVPGVGPIASTMLIAEISGLGQISTEQAAALTGLAPIARGTGA